ncbi:MAG TPA: succinate dehydrogenase, cytochrome b556 subunit [Cellvibrionaceae bacterium]
MNKSRPVNLDMTTITLPVTGYVSILHRLSGVISLVGVLGLIWLLDATLSSEAGFVSVQKCFSSLGAKVVIWAILSALAYHLVAGVRHLIMDMGVGESLEGGRLGAKLVLVVAAIFIVGLGVWLW